ncbi:glycoside hydrolase family 1 protein [Streptococcus dysgalactiae]|uniref:glycoside hydrolase family 1 protein n=1 Tax=Streptococcus dysgalactiae TaxID=1334 RepID=UPI00299E4CA1|nr:family 1 glycosylhydrolase [Streptococcus dysgalactiae]
MVDFDNSQASRLLNPKLSTAAQDFYQMGQEAARLLLQKIESPQKAVNSCQLPVQLFIRESSHFINLHHFDLPIELYQTYGDWESKHVVELFVAFSKVCFQEFGDRVKDWFVHNEPMVVVEGSYLMQFHYPAIVDGKKAVQVAYNLALVTAKVIQAYRRGPAELWNNDLFMEAAVHGKFPEELVVVLKKDGVLWQSTPEELALIAENRLDYLGLNFYHPKRVKAPAVIPVISPSWSPEWYYDPYLMPGRRMNVDKGWEIYPEAVYDIAVKMRDHYDNIPWFLSENGVGISGEERYRDETGRIQDDYRIQFLKEHLTHLHKGIEAGSNCFGYHVWTPIDGWSWLNAYKNRYGLVENNIHNQVRRPKASAYWFKEVANHNRLT